jgi:hypothetical protein
MKETITMRISTAVSIARCVGCTKKDGHQIRAEDTYHRDGVSMIVRLTVIFKNPVKNPVNYPVLTKFSRNPPLNDNGSEVSGGLW